MDVLGGGGGGGGGGGALGRLHTCASRTVQSIAVAFVHCALRDHVRQELSVGGVSRKWHGLEYARVWKPCRHFA